LKNKQKTVVLWLLLFFLTFLQANEVRASESDWYDKDFFDMPLKVPYVVTCEFGYRIDPFTKKKSYHHGIDLACKKGTDVYSSMNGVVTDVVYGHSVYGNMIKIRSASNEYETVYAHLDSINVNNMERVYHGETVIGRVGSTGKSTGPHLHLEVRTHNAVGVFNVYKNPREYLSGIKSATNVDDVAEATGHSTTGIGSNKELKYGLTLYAISHCAGAISLHILGGYPNYDVYKSFDRKKWTFMGSISNNLYVEYGLDNVKTVYYKVVDNYGKYAITGYTPISLNKQLYPLQVVQIEDSVIHVNWDMIDFGSVDMFLNGNKILTGYGGSGYTITGLAPNTKYKLYVVNSYGYRSNTITFYTTNKMDKIEELLTKLFKPSVIDSNSDGTPDVAEPIESAIDEAISKITGDVHNKVIDSVKYLSKDSNFTEDIPDEFTIGTKYKGMDLVVMDLKQDFFKPYIANIRNLLTAILTVIFVILVISLFDIQFKV
jgi:murein DD-endopeptidase MepM/ murein hydrolase activator NlpD